MSRKPYKKLKKEAKLFHDTMEEIRNWLLVSDPQNFSKFLHKEIHEMDGEFSHWDDCPVEEMTKLNQEMEEEQKIRKELGFYEVIFERYLLVDSFHYDDKEYYKNLVKIRKCLFETYGIKFIRYNLKTLRSVIKIKDSYFEIPAINWDLIDRWNYVRKVERKVKTSVIYV